MRIAELDSEIPNSAKKEYDQKVWRKFLHCNSKMPGSDDQAVGLSADVCDLSCPVDGVCDVILGRLLNTICGRHVCPSPILVTNI